MANNVPLDERTGYEPSRLDLHCLDRHLFRSTGLNELNPFQKEYNALESEQKNN